MIIENPLFITTSWIKSVKTMRTLSFKPFLIACAFLASFGEGKADSLPDIKVATSADNPPYEFLENGHVTGLDIDIITEAAKRSGYNVIIKDMTFDGILGTLITGKTDAAIAGISATPERKKSVDFSQNYIDAKVALITKVTSEDPTVLSGKTIGVQSTTYNEVFATTTLMEKSGPFTVKSLPKIPDLVQELRSGRIQGIVIGELEAKMLLPSLPNCEAHIVGTEASYAIAFPKGSPLIDPFNKAISSMKEDGTINQLYEKWSNPRIENPTLGLQFSALIPYAGMLWEGILVTLKFTLFSLLAGLPLGILLALFKISRNRLVTFFAAAYTSLFRGTPLLVQLGIFYHGIPQITGYTLSAFEAGVITFALNSAAYSSEIIRAGIESIDIGQWEASQLLGISRYNTILKIILPQAIRNILPALVNEMVDLLKESALVSTIGEADLLRQVNKISAEKFLYFEPLIIAAVCYYIMVMIVSQLAKIIERRLKNA